MSDTKHTPGPWEMVDTRLKVVGRHALRGGISVVSRGKETTRPSEYYDNGYLIAESFEAEEYGNPIGLLEGEANATLIAAAPDLLAALVTMLHTDLVKKPSSVDEFEIRSDVLEQAREAIRKAKGETHA